MIDDTNRASEEAFESEIRQFIRALQAELGDGEFRWFYDDQSEILYIELDSLHNLDESTIEQKTSPIFDTFDLDFEEIILLPLVK